MLDEGTNADHGASVTNQPIIFAISCGKRRTIKINMSRNKNINVLRKTIVFSTSISMYQSFDFVQNETRKENLTFLTISLFHR